MSKPFRFTTLRIGVSTLNMGGHVFQSEVRVLKNADGSYHVLSGALSEPLPSIEAAVARAEASERLPPNVSREIRWRHDNAPRGTGERACPVCGTPTIASARYPRQLCLACVLEATDSGGRSLHFSNTDMSGGFEARYADDGSRYDSHECFVRGIRCWADEHRFGGIVVQPSTAPAKL